MFKKAVALSLTLMVSACSSMGGNPNMFDNDYLKSHLIKGKTSQSEVATMLGQPESKMNLSSIDTEVWKYTDNNASIMANSALSNLKTMVPGGAVASVVTSGIGGKSTRILSVNFTGDGLVKSYSLSN